MHETDTFPPAEEFFPRRITLKSLAAACQGCKACPLYLHATQAVFGEGIPAATLMLVGEQPGDQEDLAGKPFVGPAGRVLDEALAAARIDRTKVYVTNAVKHFKWEPRGKRRLHAKPSTTEIMACRPWLLEEIRLLAPRVIVCMGATAAQSLLGKTFRLTQHRGEFQAAEIAGVNAQVLATVHPSSILRIPDQEARHAARRDFTADFSLAAQRLAATRRAS
ncbi:MAG TPA: UdgX family uracil-DNA binding protein [Phycisphaerae bacterium]|nr:UdgX family uracil-DNA binding protein [Phycisphaerae bacterium]